MFLKALVGSVASHLAWFTCEYCQVNGGEGPPEHGSNAHTQGVYTRDTHPGISNEPISTTVTVMPLR